MEKKSKHRLIKSLNLEFAHRLTGKSFSGAVFTPSYGSDLCFEVEGASWLQCHGLPFCFSLSVPFPPSLLSLLSL